MKSKVPELLDISPTNCLNLDEKYAVEVFMGKAFEESVSIFSSNPSHYSDLLHAMGPAAFNYYFPAFLSAITSASPTQFELDSLLIVLEVRFNILEDSSIAFKDILPCLANALLAFTNSIQWIRIEARESAD